LRLRRSPKFGVDGAGSATAWLPESPGLLVSQQGPALNQIERVSLGASRTRASGENMVKGEAGR